MRLTHIRLSGFKSFVEPTTIHTDAQMIGVVGPNGCGKSNIVDAIRWVLGESRASALRGHSMSDVIFSGTAQRPSVSRASVELSFVNHLGKVVGPWSRYEAIQVKRTVVRDGGSEYFLNNSRVRRRDVAELFMGTGVGSRHYAIVEQGTIAQFVDAKSDILRQFLEEAAGVSRYRERRRETEVRLASTRDNLLRVEDLLCELAEQAQRLQVQAQEARKYKALQQSANLLTIMIAQQKLSATADELRQITLQIARQETALASLNQEMTASDSKRIVLEERLHECNQALQNAQAKLYEANSVLVSLQADKKLHDHSEHSIKNQLLELKTRLEVEQQKLHGYTQNEARLHAQTQTADASLRVIQAQLAQHLDEKKTLQARYESQQRKTEALRGQFAQSKKNEALLQRDRVHHRDTFEELEQRRRQNNAALAKLHRPDDERLAEQSKLLRVNQDLLGELTSAATTLTAQCQTHAQALQQAKQAVAEQQKRIDGWQNEQRILQSLQSEQPLACDFSPPLWQTLQVQSPWQQATASSLGQRLNAQTATVAQIIDYAAVLATGQASGYTALVIAESNTPVEPAVDDALLNVITVDADHAASRRALTHWLYGRRTIDDLSTALQRREELAPGHCWLLPDGTEIYRHAVVFNRQGEAQTPQVLQRAERIRSFAARIAEARQALRLAEATLITRQQALSASNQALEDNQSRQQQLTQTVHQTELILTQLNAQARHYAQDLARLQAQQQQIVEQFSAIDSTQVALQTQQAVVEQTIATQQAEVSAAEKLLAELGQTVGTNRRAIEQAKQHETELTFSLRESQRRWQDTQKQIAEAGQAHDQLTKQHDEAQQALANLVTRDFDQQLHAALTEQTQCEQRLAETRTLQAHTTQALREVNEHSQLLKSKIEPTRQQCETLRLHAKELETHLLTFETAMAAFDSEQIEAAQQPYGACTKNELNRILAENKRKIEALGAVNLAAVEVLSELEARIGFLQTQKNDLLTAMHTLEEAVKKIDRETRARLRETYQAVNRNLDEIYPELFAGGQARLHMQGEEILDAHLEIMAQPPGKKETLLHLLSGGEKALTALSLVFAFFKLNPAPFCVLDEVDAPLDDANVWRFSKLMKKLSPDTQFLFVSHNKSTISMADLLVGITMREAGVSRVVDVDVAKAVEYLSE